MLIQWILLLHFVRDERALRRFPIDDCERIHYSGNEERIRQWMRRFFKRTESSFSLCWRMMSINRSRSSVFNAWTFVTISEICSTILCKWEEKKWSFIFCEVWHTPYLLNVCGKGRCWRYFSMIALTIWERNRWRFGKEWFPYECSWERYPQVEDLIDIWDIDEEFQQFVEDIYYYK